MKCRQFWGGLDGGVVLFFPFIDTRDKLFFCQCMFWTWEFETCIDIDPSLSFLSLLSIVYSFLGWWNWSSSLHGVKWLTMMKVCIKQKTFFPCNFQFRAGSASHGSYLIFFIQLERPLPKPFCFHELMDRAWNHILWNCSPDWFVIQIWPTTRSCPMEQHLIGNYTNHLYPCQ